MQVAATRRLWTSVCERGFVFWCLKDRNLELSCRGENLLVMPSFCLDFVMLIPSRTSDSDAVGICDSCVRLLLSQAFAVQAARQFLQSNPASSPSPKPQDHLKSPGLYPLVALLHTEILYDLPLTPEQLLAQDLGRYKPGNDDHNDGVNPGQLQMQRQEHQHSVPGNNGGDNRSNASGEFSAALGHDSIVQGGNSGDNPNSNASSSSVSPSASASGDIPAVMNYFSDRAEDLLVLGRLGSQQLFGGALNQILALERAILRKVQGRILNRAVSGVEAESVRCTLGKQGGAPGGLW